MNSITAFSVASFLFIESINLIDRLWSHLSSVPSDLRTSATFNHGKKACSEADACKTIPIPTQQSRGSAGATEPIQCAAWMEAPNLLLETGHRNGLFGMLPKPVSTLPSFPFYKLLRI